MSKFRILYFSDTHLGFDYPVSGKSKHLRRGFDFFNNFHFILQQAKTRRVDLVIHGGDLFFRSKVPDKVVNQTYDALFELADCDIPLIIVPGNHDRSTLPVSLFLEHPNIHIFRQPDIFHFNLQGIKLQVAGFPYVKLIGKELPAILEQINEKIKPHDLSILCMHQAVEGATVGPVDYTFRAGPDVVKPSDLDGNFTAYLSGHIHRHQILYFSGIPFIYPGSIERTAFAERFEEKGYMYLDFDHQGLVDMQFERLPSRPMFIVELPDDPVSRKSLLSSIKPQIDSLPENAAVLISSPSKIISEFLNQKFLKDLFVHNLHIQVRHKWLKDL